MTPTPILEDKIHRDGRGPELQRIIWARATPRAFEYFNPEDEVVPRNLRHLRLFRVEAFAFAGEEVHGNIVSTPDSAATVHDLGQTPWMRSLDPQHLDGCSHYQVVFYDEVFDIVCAAIEAHRGPFVAGQKSRQE